MVFIIFGILWEVLLYIGYRQNQKLFSKTGIRTIGKLIEIVELPDQYGDCEYYGIVEYNYNGSIIKAKTNKHFINTSYNVGDNIEIYYDSNNPEVVVVDDKIQTKKINNRFKLGFIVGIIPIIYGMYLLLSEILLLIQIFSGKTYSTVSESKSYYIDSKVIFAIIVIIIVLLFTKSIISHVNNSRRRTAITKGTIIRKNKHYSREINAHDSSAEVFIPVVEYYVDNYHVERELNSNLYSVDVGDEVVVRYNPKNIYDFSIDESNYNFFKRSYIKGFIILFLFILVIFLVVVAFQ